MNTGAFNALGLMVLRVLGLNPVAAWRPASKGGSEMGKVGDYITSSDLINTIVDITASDVSFGETPIYLVGVDKLVSPELRERTQQLCTALNRISNWAATDLLKRGISLYVLHQDTQEDGAVKPILIPYEVDVQVFMTKSGGIKLLTAEGQEVKNVLMFLNYSKESLEKITESTWDFFTSKTFDKDDLLYQVLPEPIQLKNLARPARDLAMTEQAIYRYRQQLSRIVRYVTVDVGVSQGDRVTDAIDDVSQALNANSMSLTAGVGLDSMLTFDDAIPIIPVRKGVGKPELSESIPDFSGIKDLGDLDYTLGRIFMGTRFPKTYADFNTNLSDTTVSLLRGDVRYTHLVNKCRTLMERTINDWYHSEVQTAHSEEVKFHMTKLPGTEDSDVVEVLSAFADFSNSFFSSVNDAETEEEAMGRLDSLEALLADTSNLPSIQKWFVATRAYIKDKFKRIAKEEERQAAEAAESEAQSREGSAFDDGGLADTGFPASATEAESAQGRDAEREAQVDQLLSERAEAIGAPPAVPEE